MVTWVAWRFALVLVSAICAAGQDVPTHSLVSGNPLGPGNVRQLSYSPDGNLLAVLTTVEFQIREATNGRLLNTIVGEAPESARVIYYPEPWLSELCWSPDGKRIARANGGIEVWDPLASTPERILPADTTDKAFHELAWSPTGKQIAAHSGAGIVVWDLDSDWRTAIPEQAPNDGVPQISGFAWSPRGGQLAIVAGIWESEVIDVWDVARRVRVRRIPVGQKPPKGRSVSDTAQVVELPFYQGKVEWSPDGQVLALSSGFSGLSLWNERTGSLMLRTRREKGLASITENVISLSWSRDSTILRVATPHHIRFLNRDSGEQVYAVGSENKRWMRCVAGSPDGERLAASFDDGEIVLRRSRNPVPVAHILMGPFGDTLVALSPDLRYIAGESAQEWAGVWDLLSAQKVAQFKAYLWGYGEYAWSPDGRNLARVQGGELPNVLLLLQPSAGQSPRSISLPPSNYSSYTTAFWSPDETRVLVTGSSDAVVSVESGAVLPVPAGRGTLLWTAAGDLVRLLAPIPVRPGNVLQSPDFRYAALLGTNDKLVVWDTQENRVLWTVDFPPGRQLSQVAWSPDSRQLAYVSTTGALDIWDMSAGRIIEHWTAPSIPSWRPFAYLTWGQKLLAVECLGGAVRLWHTL
jgi:WD40 repeat protein